MLVQLLHTDNTYQGGVLAARIEKMFDTVSDEDIEQMSSGIENLVGVVRKILEDRVHDPLLFVLVDMQEADRPTRGEFESFVAFLRDQGVTDSEVDLFWSVIKEDKSLAEGALQPGAKLDVTEGAIISRYKGLWEKFKTERTKQ